MQIMVEHKDSMSDCKMALIKAALAAGGYDNVTTALCLVTIEETEGQKELDKTLFSKPPKKSRKMFYLLALLIVLLIVSCLFFFPELSSWLKTIGVWESDTTVAGMDTLNLNGGL